MRGRLIPSRYLSKFSEALVKHPVLATLVTSLEEQFATYAADLRSLTPTFTESLTRDSLQNRTFIIDNVGKFLANLRKMITRVQAIAFKSLSSTSLGLRTNLPSPAVMEVLRRFFEPPGEIREGGPRHDNDHAHIQDIRILPTHEELLSPLPPFIPANLAAAPHHLPSGTMNRQLDTVFRLLREDFLAPLRTSVSALFHDLGDARGKKNSPLLKLVAAGGGRYRANDGGSANTNSVDLNVYTEVGFKALALTPAHDLVAQLDFRMPPGFAKKHSFVKRLARGNLVGLLSRHGANEAHIYLGVVTEEPGTSAAKQSVSISFFDDEIYLQAILQLAAQHARRRSGSTSKDDEMLFFEVPGFLIDTLRPFLEALQRAQPNTIPFGKYISAVPGPTAPTTIDPPLYARNPNFKYELRCLLVGDEANESLELDTGDPRSVAQARDVLASSSRLDPSQADALVDCLTREVAIVEGCVQFCSPGGRPLLTLLFVQTAWNWEELVRFLCAFRHCSLANHLGCAGLESSSFACFFRTTSDESSCASFCPLLVPNKILTFGRSQLGLHQPCARHDAQLARTRRSYEQHRARRKSFEGGKHGEG